jgi:dipeptidyl aminopeptidase/acylaminoacyl peptidase
MHRLRRAAARLIAAIAVVAATPVWAADPPPLSAYGDLPGLEDAALSPGGHLAVLGDVKGKRMLVVLDPAMKPIKAMEIPAIKVRGIDWAGDDTILLTRSETVDLGDRFVADKGEITNVMLIPLDDERPVREVFAGERKLVKAVFGGGSIRAVGGKWVGYFSGREMVEQQDGSYMYEGASSSLYAVDVTTNEPKRLARPPVRGIYREWLIDATGEISATLDWKSGTRDWTIVNRTGAQIAAGNQSHGEIELVAFGNDGTSVIYNEDDGDGVAHWFQVPLDGSAEASEVFADQTIDTIFVQPYSSRMIGYRPDDGDDSVVFFDPARQSAVDGINKAFEHVNPRLRDWTPDFGKVLISTNGNGDSGTWYLLDTVHKQSNLVGVERPQIGARVGPISTVDYKAADGTELRGILTLPLDGRRTGLPLVVLPHGGPHSHDLARFDWWAQAFASRGYAVFQPNFRGSTDRDEAFRQASYGQWGRKMQTDISDGVAELARQGIIDPARACIVGASYGGYAALAGVTLQQGLYRCAVAVAGVSDLKMMYERELLESGRNRFLKANLKEELGEPSTLDQVSPRRLARRADAPILLIHGKDDTVVPFNQSAVMADALKDAGKPYEMVVLDKEDHWLSRAETRKQMLEAAVAFVEEYNPPN